MLRVQADQHVGAADHVRHLSLALVRCQVGVLERGCVPEQDLHIDLTLGPGGARSQLLQADYTALDKCSKITASTAAIARDRAVSRHSTVR